MKNLENSINNQDISVFLNFAKKKKAIYFGIKSILRNKTKIKLIIKIRDDSINNNLEKDLQYLKNNFNIDVIEIDRENILKSSINFEDNLKTIAISDKDLSIAILNKIGK